MNSTENLTVLNELKATGGGVIGNGRATWPFATLTVNRNLLKLSVSLIGTVMFRPSDVVSIEPYSGGIKINHTVQGYNSTVVFLTLSNTQQLIAKIRATGFLDNKGPIPADLEDEISRIQTGGSFPVKTSAVVFFVVIWNLLFLGGELPFLLKRSKELSFLGAQWSLLFALLFCFSVLFITPIRRIVLKEQRSIKEVQAILYFIIIISVIMLTVFTQLK